VAAASVGATSATIQWQTDELADSQVEFGMAAAYGVATVLQPMFVAGHSVNVTGLLPQTTYHFRVLSRDPSGNAVKFQPPPTL
jgi:chitodextrinase